ncbi:MAG: ABC transporter ATP-binding protein [Pseudomonadota bacterium]|nr:MAG: ABC transporter ATP-binding protein [Pseudomonadota bacterium]
MTVLRVRTLRKTLNGHRPLLDIDELAIAPGTCTMLTGPNGAGKTTLLKILAGLDSPDSAIMEYDGEEMSWSAARRRYRGAIIYLHQHAYLFDRSVAQNVGYGLNGGGLSRQERAARVARALDWAGLAHLADRNARELSGGEQQRVVISRAFVLAPRVLLLDEPFAGLDEEARTRTCFLIQRLKSERVAVVVTSHETLWLSSIVDRHLVLRDGKIAPAVVRPRESAHTKRNPPASVIDASAPLALEAEDERI